MQWLMPFSIPGIVLCVCVCVCVCMCVCLCVHGIVSVQLMIRTACTCILV